MKKNNELILDDAIIGQFEDPGDVTEWIIDDLKVLTLEELHLY